ncbi:Rieske (2Fe-2S) protein [candidate division KSB1 bacterium]
MIRLVKVARTGSVPENGGIVVRVEGRPIAVFYKNGSYYATDDTCPHEGGSLGQGEVEGDIVTCPWHEWRFNIKTGESLELPGYSIATYPVKIKDNDILIEWNV